MLTETEARQFAQHWIAAWNSHDLDALMSHYGEEVVLTSPVAAHSRSDPGTALRGPASHASRCFVTSVAGKEALGRYFKRGLEAYPNLKFELLDVMWGVSSVVLYYINQKGTKTGEFMEFDADLKVIRVVANYNG